MKIIHLKVRYERKSHKALGYTTKTEEYFFRGEVKYSSDIFKDPDSDDTTIKLSTITTGYEIDIEIETTEIIANTKLSSIVEVMLQKIHSISINQY